LLGKTEGAQLVLIHPKNEENYPRKKAEWEEEEGETLILIYFDGGSL
jgi:hypothetical protein